MKETVLDKPHWDRYRAFHKTLNCAVIVFDTGEVIATQAQPRPDYRGYCANGIRIATTNDVGSLWTPEGVEMKNAWLDDRGQQYLFIDQDSGRAVRTDGPYRPSSKRPDHIHGIPTRFQTEAVAYMAGPGAYPVGVGKIAVRPPHKISCTPDELEHVDKILHTFRSAMTLTDDECTRGSLHHLVACPFDYVLGAHTWQDIKTHQRDLFHMGVANRKLEFDWLLVNEPSAKAA